MTTSAQPASLKPESNNIVLKLIALLAYFTTMSFLIWFVRRRRKASEADMLRRIDKAMGKPSDDPRQMARFMR